MEINDIREIIRAVDNSSITEFEYQSGETKISMKKLSGTVHREIIEAPLEDRKPVRKEAESPTESDKKTDENLHIIKSPIVGTFYASPNPESEPFVKIGSRVKKGDVLCIVEAMKLMNEITSDVDGEIIEVLVENQSIIEYGQPLFSIRKV